MKQKLSWHRNLIPVIASGFLLSGVVPFSLYLSLGLIYTIGGEYQIISIVTAVFSGSYIFTALGLLSARIYRTGTALVFALAIASFFSVYILLGKSRVLTLEQLWIFAFLNMSSNAIISSFVSHVTRTVRGQFLSVKHTLSIGSGSPFVFFMAFAIYIYFNYSHLPLITLAAEFFAFGLSAALIKHYSRHKQKRGGASDVI